MDTALPLAGVKRRVFAPSLGSVDRRALPFLTHDRSRAGTLTEVSIAMDQCSFFTFYVSFLLLFGLSAAQPAPDVLHHPDLGYALFLPLSRHPGNHSSARHERISRLRHLLDGPDTNARMSLYDDLLTKGYYTTRLWIGSPPQEFALIVDTGSTVTYVPCSSCTQCGVHQDPRFSPEASSTYKPVECGPSCSSCDSDRHQCKYLRRYAEMSTSEGLLGVDLVSFGNISTLGPERLVFGCETAESGDIYEQKADGIMGLGRGSLSIVDQLVNRNAMTAAFSLCYGGMDEGGGAMIMGAIPNPPQMVFTRSNFKRSAYYNLGLQQVIVGGTPLSVDQGVFDSNFGTVLDSGTTYAYFPDKAFKALTAALSEHVKLPRVAGPDSHYPDICYEGAGSDVSKLSDHFPEVQLKFGDGKLVSLAPQNYLFKHLKVPGSYCLGIFSNGKNSATLLGGIVVRNMLVTYDRVNQQIGFWRTNCSDLWNNLQAATTTTISPTGAPLAPPALAPQESSSILPGPIGVSGTVDVVMYLNTKFNDFDSLKSMFLESISEELHVNKSQVNIVNIADTGGNVTVTITVEIAATDKHLLNDRAQRIIAQLNNKEVRLGNAFGEYQVMHWTIVPENKRSEENKSLFVLVGLVVALFVVISSAIGFSVWWFRRRSRDQKYMSIQQSVEMSDKL